MRKARFMTPSFRPASPGTGSLRPRRVATWTLPLEGALLAGVLALVGCSPDVKDGLGPRVPVPNVSGRVERDGVAASQAALVAPADAATLGLPNASDPVTFRWSLPRHGILSARAQLYNASGAAVWYSAKSSDSSAVWDGTGNQGTYTGVGLPAAT